MSTLIDARAHQAAVKAAIASALGSAHAYSYGEVPGSNGNAGTLPNIFAVIAVERRNNPLLRLTAQAGATGWRVSVRSVGRTVAESQWAAFKVGQALNQARLTIDGDPTTPIQIESDQAPVFDDGRYSGTTLYVYAH